MYHIRHIARGEWHVAEDKGEALAVLKTRAEARRTLKEMQAAGLPQQGVRQTRLHNWAFVATGVNPYTAPECIALRMRGEVYNHPNHHDGDAIATSVVTAEVTGRLVECKSRTYQLIGPPNAAWAKAMKFHGAYPRYQALIEGAS